MHGKSKLIYFIEYSWLFILLLFASVVYLNQGGIELFFNSDILASVLIIKDLFFQHGHYKNWMVPAAHHFFPELFIASLIYCVVKNIYLFFLIMVWTSIISIYIGVKLIYRQFFSVKNAIFFALMATSGFFLLVFHYYRASSIPNINPYAIAQVPFVHVGEFIAGLFFLGMQINLINKDKLTYKEYILLAISAFIAFACSLSDLLFFVQFASPIFISYSFFVLTRKIKFYRYLLLSSLIILPAILGVFSAKYLIPNYMLIGYLTNPSLIKVSFSTINIQLLEFIQLIKLNISYLIGIILGIFYFSLIFILTNQFFFNDKKNIKDHIDKKLFLILFVFLSTFFSIVSQFCLAGKNYVSLRYMLPLFYFPILFFFFLIPYLNNKLLTSKKSNYLTGLFFIYIIVGLLVFINKPAFKLHMSYYPQYVRCIDKALRGYGHNGIAQYWEANLITALSKEDIEVVPVLNLTPFVWFIKKTKFEKPFNFVILELFINRLPFPSLEKALVYPRYGMPDKVVVCGKRKILIYSKTFTL